MFASANVKARAWLLIEHNAPWPELRDDYSTLPAPIARAFAAADAAGVRPQLIRRPGARRPGSGVTVMAGWSQGPEPWLESVTLEGLDALDELDLEGLGRGERPVRGTPHLDPVFLVCTHAKRNACCARLGGPLARYLREHDSGEIWETSHVGGDRFAANLICLPHGLYYGNMSPAAALAAVTAYRSGEVILDRFRGRSGMSEPLQAAEHFVRVHTGERSLGGVVVESFSRAGDATEVLILGGGVRYKVVVEPAVRASPCGSACGGQTTTYRLRQLREHHGQ